MLNQTIQTVKLDNEQYAQIDTEHNLVTIHRGQQTGADTDWGGQVIASLELDKALAIAEAVKALKIQQEVDLFLQARMRRLNTGRLGWMSRKKMLATW